MSQQAMQATRMLVAGFDWSTRRVERFHKLIADYAKTKSVSGTESDQAYEFVRTIGKEVGETVTGAITLTEAAKHSLKARSEAASPKRA